MKRCQNELGGKSNGKTRPSEHQSPSADWNVAVTFAERTFGEARILLAKWGKLRRTQFHNVSVMSVVDPVVFREEFAAAVHEAPGILNSVSHVTAFEQTFEFSDASDFQRQARATILEWVPRLARKSFHVRLHRRGLKGVISTPAEERLLDDVLLEALVAAGTPGKICFDDPDAIVLIETVGNRAGLALHTRRDLAQKPFIAAD
jgi:tRNA(Ser,Leu) C12 N-acetylase TAN1